METVHLLIKGKVQGVFFRASAKKIAESLALKGWIKNTKEGHVESVVSGNHTSVIAFIEWCKTGPGKANVSDVVVVTQRDEEIFEHFLIIT